MEYTDYNQYLHSDLWREIRKMVLKKYGDKCLLCGKPYELIHHNGYSKAVLSGKDIHTLKPLCNDCHERIEFDEYGNKRSVRSTRRLQIRMRKEYLARSINMHN